MPKAQTKVAERYAKALVRLMPQDKHVEVLNSLKTVLELFTNDSIERVLKSPVVQPDLKSKILGVALGQIDANPQLIQFCSNLAKAGRTDQLPAIYESYNRLLNQRAGIVQGEVTSAFELDEESKVALTSTLENKLGKKPKLNFKLDPEIIGGLVIELDNAKIDLSLKTKVDSLSKYALT